MADELLLLPSQDGTLLMIELPSIYPLHLGLKMSLQKKEEKRDFKFLKSIAIPGKMYFSNEIKEIIMILTSR